MERQSVGRASLASAQAAPETPAEASQDVPRLMLRSSKVINESSPSVAWGRWYAAPHPRAGAGIEPTGRHPGREGDLARVGEGLPGQRLTAEQPPPALLQVEPAGPLGDEGVLDAGMVGQP